MSDVSPPGDGSTAKGATVGANSLVLFDDHHRQLGSTLLDLDRPFRGKEKYLLSEVGQPAARNFSIENQVVVVDAPKRIRPLLW